MKLNNRRTYYFEMQIFFHDPVVAEAEKLASPAQRRLRQKRELRPTHKVVRMVKDRRTGKFREAKPASGGRRKRPPMMKHLLAGVSPEPQRTPRKPINSCVVQEKICIYTVRMGVSRMEYFKNYGHNNFIFLVENNAGVINPPDGAMVHMVWTGEEMKHAHNVRHSIPAGSNLVLGQPIATWDRVNGEWLMRLTKHEQALLDAPPKRGSHAGGMRRVCQRLLDRRRVVAPNPNA